MVPFLDPFLHGLSLGLAVSMPIGPIGVLCIQRSLDRSWLHGFTTGLGAVAADLIYAFVAASGIGLVSGFFERNATWFKIPAALLLVFVGIRLIRASRKRPENAPARGGHRGVFIVTFSLMLSNPLTLVFFTAVFAALGGSATIAAPGARWILIVGVAAGCLSWWAVLAWLATRLRRRLTAGSFLWINRLSGAFLIGFAGYLVLFH